MLNILFYKFCLLNLRWYGQALGNFSCKSIVSATIKWFERRDYKQFWLPSFMIHVAWNTVYGIWRSCLLFAGLCGNLQYMSWQWDVYQDQSNSSRNGATNSNTMQGLWWKWRKNIRYLQPLWLLGNLATWQQYECNLIRSSWGYVPEIFLS